ncbi:MULTISPECIES: hypothetical protein [Halomonadaceae]|nr:MULTISPECIES: hypothetical protein [Halomonas]
MDRMDRQPGTDGEKRPRIRLGTANELAAQPLGTSGVPLRSAVA